ncbi:MAG: arsenic efflux protein [Ruminococcus sp.]|jgi:hypothetical protein|nr:arsenic efflux protein [Ruminococcus sp.]
MIPANISDVIFTTHIHADLHGGAFDIFSVLFDAFFESVRIVPFLFAAFLLMEFLEHKAGDKFVSILSKSGKFVSLGPVAGSVLGAVPQCGFSVAAANLYAGKIISVGTLAAVFISTSDEAIPILLSSPGNLSVIWKLILIKIAIGLIAGILIDIFVRIFNRIPVETDFEEICIDCNCGKNGIWLSSLKHTVNIFIFILILNIIMGVIIGLIGEEPFFHFLEGFGVFQPVVTALVGFIPNCASSVLITELYIDGGLTFGSTVAGLCSGAGVGLLVLFKANKNLKANFCILGILFFTAVLSGTILDILF